MGSRVKADALAFDGVEWAVDAYECSPDSLRDIERLTRLFDRIVAEMDLRPIGSPIWHRFPHSGGLTGFLLLEESHLACHSFPELGTLCLNLFCCRARQGNLQPRWFEETVGAKSVSLQCFQRAMSASRSH